MPPGGKATIEVRVEFAHRQPCPYSDWKILYEVVEGDVEVIEASKPSIEARSATMTITIQARGNDTLSVIYKYGTGCLFGDEERAEVKVIVAKEAVSQPQPAEGLEAAYLKAAKALYEARGLLLLVLALASLAVILFLSRRGSNPRPGKRKLTIVREMVAAIVFVPFVLVPVALTGSICPCMIGALQEGILTLFKGVTLSDILSNSIFKCS